MKALGFIMNLVKNVFAARRNILTFSSFLSRYLGDDDAVSYFAIVNLNF